MKYLQQQGFIVDTGDKAGQTKQIAIYLLRTPEPHGAGGVEQSQISVETVPKTEAFAGAVSGASVCLNTTRNSTEYGTVEQA
ncbi:hypothetical protein, partial [Streptomyces brasiliscabiei]|uniref:hypothetical protein n=1 Tax=Streptomyces brasiliscabiei TaxID=2736302 RepID=UPI0030155829